MKIFNVLNDNFWILAARCRRDFLFPCSQNAFTPKRLLINEKASQERDARRVQAMDDKANVHCIISSKKSMKPFNSPLPSAASAADFLSCSACCKTFTISSLSTVKTWPKTPIEAMRS